jgi:hypothetical protein
MVRRQLLLIGLCLMLDLTAGAARKGPTDRDCCLSAERTRLPTDLPSKSHDSFRCLWIVSAARMSVRLISLDAIRDFRRWPPGPRPSY